MAVIQRAPLAGVGISYSSIMTPLASIRPILLAKFSVNQSSPSVVTATLRADAFGVGMANSPDRAVARDTAKRVGAGLDEPDAAVGM